MKKKPFIVAALSCIALAALCGLRIEQVNASYPEQHTYSYAFGEEATYAGQNSSGENVEPDMLTLKVLDFRSIDYSRLQELVPGYLDSSIEEGSASDMRALMVDVEITNVSNNIQKAHVRDFHLESGAWMNGLYAPLYMSINDDPFTIIELQTGETAQRTLVYLIYNVSMNNRTDWSKVEERSYSLELALYPDKYVICLGAPSADNKQGDAA